MKKKLQFIIQLLAICWIIVYLMNNKENFKEILKLNTSDITFLLILVPIGISIRSMELVSYMSILNFKINFHNSFKITAGSTMLNYLPLSVGFFYKAKILKNF